MLVASNRPDAAASWPPRELIDSFLGGSREVFAWLGEPAGGGLMARCEDGGLIGETLAPYPEDVVIATKAGLVRPGPGNWRPNGRPEHIREAIEGCGGSSNAATDRESTVYWVRVPRREAARAMDVLGELIVRPTLADHEIEGEHNSRSLFYELEF